MLVLPSALAIDGRLRPRCSFAQERAATPQLKERDRLKAEAGRLREQGRTDDAIAVHLKKLAIEREVFGDVHAQVADSLRILAELYEEREDFPAARKLRQQVVDLRTRLHGADHWTVTDARQGLAHLDVLAKLTPAQRRQIEEGNQQNRKTIELYQQGKLAQAVKSALEVLEIRKQTLGERHPDYVAALNILAVLHRLQGDYPRAETFYRQALRINREVLGEKHPDYATSLNNLGFVYKAQNDYIRAEPAYRQALELRKQVLGEKHPSYALSLNNLAALYDSMGEYAQAEPLYRQALQLRKQILGDRHADYAATLNNLAVLYVSVGDHAKAEPLYLQAVEINKQVLGTKHPDYATSLSNLAYLYSAMGAYAKAEPLYRQALDVRRGMQGDKQADHATSLDNLAMLYKSMGDYAKAEPLCRQALDIRKQIFGDKHPFFASTLNNLALLYDSMGQDAKAEPLYRQAMEIRKQVLGGKNPGYATSLNNLATLYSARGDYVRAEPLYRQALDIEKLLVGEHHEKYAAKLHNLAAMYWSMADYAKAESHYRQALNIYKQALGERHPSYATCLNNLALVVQTLGRSAEALALQGQAMQIQQHHLRQICGFTAEPAMRAYLNSISASPHLLLNMVLTRPEDASAVTTALTWTLRRKAILLDSLCRYRQAQQMLAGDDVLSLRVGQWRRLRQRLSDLPLHPPKGADAAALREQVTKLRQEADDLEADLHRDLSKRLPQADNDDGQVDAAQVQARLPKGSALIEFVRLPMFHFKAKGNEKRWRPAHYLAFVLRAGSDSKPQLIDLGEAEAIDEALMAVRNKIEDFSRDTASEKSKEAKFKAASQELYQLLFAPLRSALGDAITIYLAPDGRLNRLPFAALVDDDGKYLIERFHCVYLSSGRDVFRPPVEAGEGTVVFAGPDYDLAISERSRAAKALRQQNGDGAKVTLGNRASGLRGLGWERLAGAEAEAADIMASLKDSRLGPVQVYLGKDALEEAFKAVRSPRILHVATHGFFLPPQRLTGSDHGGSASGTLDPTRGGLARLRGADSPLLRSGLVLAGANALEDQADVDDGWVTAEEIALMKLRGTQLVVLSACESGLGDIQAGEGVYGLRRAFLYAGARTLVTSLFKVPDAETRTLMQHFYAGLKAGKSKLLALHDAQIAMIGQRRTQGGAHPFYWASFVLVGAPD